MIIKRLCVFEKVVVLEMASRLIVKGIAGILYLVKTILKQNKKCTLEMHPKQNEKGSKKGIETKQTKTNIKNRHKP